MTHATTTTDPAATVVLVQLVQASQTGQHAQVLALCDVLAGMYQETPPITYLRGIALYYLGQKNDAIAALQRAIAQQPEGEWIEALGGIWQEDGQPHEAYRAYDHYFEVVRDNVPEALHRRYSEAMKRTGSTPFPLARRLRQVAMIDLLEQALARTDEAGWVAECGCFMGHSTLQIAETLKARNSAFDGVRLAVCDSFEGLGQMHAHDAVADDHPDAQRLRAMSKPGHFAAPFAQVQQNLSDFPAIEWVRGWIPASLAQLPDDARYRFVHVDVDMYEPTAGAFAYFWPKLLPGGMMVTDDYGWPGARKAVDEYVACLPAGSFRFGSNAHQQAWLEKCI